MSPLNIYMLVSAVITALLLVFAALKLKTQAQQDAFLKVFAIATVAIHFSILWVDYFSTGNAAIEANMLLPIYPCNIVMWMLLIVAFKKDKATPFAKMLMEFVMWGGTFCALVGIALNENYFSNPDLTNYYVLKGLLSHSTMLVGCLYLLVGKYVKIRVTNTISVALGLCFFILDGLVVNALFFLCKLPTPNAMYLQELPFPDLPWLTPLFMGTVGYLVVFGFTIIYEALTLEREEQTLSHVKAYLKRKLQ